MITQLDGIILDVNETFLGWTGFVHSGLVGRTKLIDLLTPEARVVYDIYDLPALGATGELHDSPSEIACAGGIRLPVTISSARGRAGSEDPEVIVNTITDAHARRGYERELWRARNEEGVGRRRAEGRVQELARQSRHQAAIAELGRLALAQTDAATLVSHSVNLIRGALQADGVTLLDDAAALAPGAMLLKLNDADARDYFLGIDTPASAEDLAFLESISEMLRVAIQRRHSDDHQRHLASHDQLTGLSNRALLVDRLVEALAHQARDGTPFALMMIDLNGFKAVNDTYGHPVGDELLRLIATRLISAIRGSDTAARIGGDEFAVLCEDLSGSGAANDAGIRIRAAIAEPMMISGQRIDVDASIGLAMATVGGSAEDLLRAADVDMYRRKSEHHGGLRAQ